jgi:hypothetical protein
MRNLSGKKAEHPDSQLQALREEKLDEAVDLDPAP